MNWEMIVATAIVSSLFTLLVVGIVVQVWVMPALEEHFDRKTEEAAERIERMIRQRIAQGFADMMDPLRSVLRERAGDVARSTADLVGDGLRRVMDRLGGVRYPDDKPDGSP